MTKEGVGSRDYISEYLLVDQDGECEFTNIIPDLDSACWPAKFKITECTGGGYILERLNHKNEWETLN